MRKLFHRVALSRAVAASVVAFGFLAGTTTSAFADGSSFPPPVRSQLRYDMDYPSVAYGEKATQNAIARLQEKLDSGEVKLKFAGKRGYLDSLLDALDIDPSSQVLVYSKTSLQIHVIDATTPRAVYFNDHTYVAWLHQNSDMVEIMTMDDQRGAVFYSMTNRQRPTLTLDRETSRCLTCHDTYSMSGGGVPRFMVMSVLVNVEGQRIGSEVGAETTDASPIAERWGGWFVTGQVGKQTHQGNILVRSRADLARDQPASRMNLSTLQGLLDTEPYVTDKSDVVALLVLEHQAMVHNLVTRASFKSRTVLGRSGVPETTERWSALTPDVQKRLKPLTEPLVRALLFVNAAPYSGQIASSSGFDKWFEAQGPRTRDGLSLRKLDLRTRLLKYPLSYLVYSPEFHALPAPLRDQVFGRIAEVLTGQDRDPAFNHLSADDKTAILKILAETHPEFAAILRERADPAMGS
jgi:hypothetical protein